MSLYNSIFCRAVKIVSLDLQIYRLYYPRIIRCPFITSENERFTFVDASYVSGGFRQILSEIK